jgi:hypothetical protein
MKRTKIGKKRELPLVKVLIKDIVGNGREKITCQVNEQIVPSLVVDSIKLLAHKIIEIMPEEAISLYRNEGSSLIEFLIVYSQEGDYSIAIDSAPPVLENFNNEISKIIDLLDNAVQNI